MVKELQPRDFRILEDAQKLESTARYKVPSLPPLACAHATLEQIDHVFRLRVTILWENTVNVRDKVDPILHEILARYLPTTAPTSSIFEPWKPRDFYDNVHVPAKSAANSTAIEIPLLESQLYPFQRRGVRWLLSREGLDEQPDGQFRASSTKTNSQLPLGFETRETPGSGICCVNHTLGVASTDRAAVQEHFAAVKGGILADEMGLGKTLEIISLICLHRLPSGTIAPEGLRQSCATLIITPPSILEQWKSELLEHAPALKVFHYTGVTDYKKCGEELIESLLSQDVVLTTYNVIAKEVHYVAEKPDRILRNNKKRSQPPKSPLTQISWWRIVSTFHLDFS
jgi:E3 ubiquitin-protein ligase SHPRH